MTGGSRAQRLTVVQEFHRASPIARAPFVALDCARDAERLESLLERWLLVQGPDGELEDEFGQHVGALYLDSIRSLSPVSQRLLLMIAHRLQGLDTDVRQPGPERLMAGDRSHLACATEGGRLSTALVDHLDKIRVELDSGRRRGAA